MRWEEESAECIQCFTHVYIHLSTWMSDSMNDCAVHMANVYIYRFNCDSLLHFNPLATFSHRSSSASSDDMRVRIDGTYGTCIQLKEMENRLNNNKKRHTRIHRAHGALFEKVVKWIVCLAAWWYVKLVADMTATGLDTLFTRTVCLRFARVWTSTQLSSSFSRTRKTLSRVSNINTVFHSVNFLVFVLHSCTISKAFQRNCFFNSRETVERFQVIIFRSKLLNKTGKLNTLEYTRLLFIPKR